MLKPSAPVSLKMSLLTEYLREFGRFQRNARLYLISNALSGVTIGIILVLYNLYLDALGYGTDFVGLVLFVVAVGIGVAIFPAGLCVDRVSNKAILIWASGAIGIAGAGQFIFRQPMPLLISSFVAGVASAFVVVVNAPFLTANSTPAERSHLFSLNIVVTLATTVLGELLGGVLPLWLRTLPWLMNPSSAWSSGILVSQAVPRSYQLSLLFAGIIAAPSFLPLFLMSNDRPSHPLRPIDSDKSVSIGDVVSIRQQVRQNIERVRRIPLRTVLVSPMAVLTLVQVVIGLGAGLFTPYFNLYFVRHLGASTALFGVIDGGANAINAVLTLIAPLVALRLGKINTITATRLLSIPLLLVIGLSNLLPLVAALYLFRQGAMDMSLGIFQVFSMEAVPQQRRGLANSVYQVASYVAPALTTPLGGLIIARIGYPPVFIGGALLYLLAIVLLWSRFGRGDEERFTGREREANVEALRETSAPS